MAAGFHDVVGLRVFGSGEERSVIVGGWLLAVVFVVVAVERRR